MSTSQATTIDPHDLVRFDRPVPRYTSYPTAPEWQPLQAEVYERHLIELGASKLPISLYVHVPFCRTMCLYCACSVVLNRRPEKEVTYVDYLCREIDLVAEKLGHSVVLKQLHFGGGTPTQLSESLLTRIMEKIATTFVIAENAELAMEIDPRTVVEDNGAKLAHLKELGFNRISFGVQDTNPRVQEAVRRRQSLEMTQQTVTRARELGFTKINVDLIYGLPYQTVATFAKTVTDILQLRPNRIALFSYAKVPWLKPHQKAIPDRTLPSTDEKFQIYVNARERFEKGGYTAIGMDHFGLEDDALTQAFHKKQLQRNFQGYSLRLAEDLIGVGMTATGFVRNAYFQNVKELDLYYATLDRGQLPILRGKELDEDDTIRRYVIQTIMCDFALDFAQFEDKTSCRFWSYFAAEYKQALKLEQEGLVQLEEDRLVATFHGSLFIRNVAAIFDRYYNKISAINRFSKGV